MKIKSSKNQYRTIIVEINKQKHSTWNTEPTPNCPVYRRDRPYHGQYPPDLASHLQNSSLAIQKA